MSQPNQSQPAIPKIRDGQSNINENISCYTPSTGDAQNPEAPPIGSGIGVDGTSPRCVETARLLIETRNPYNGSPVKITYQ